VPRNYLDERIAMNYEAKWPELFDWAVVDPTVHFLADLAGTGAALEPGGCFVIEVGVPALQRLPPGETVRAFTVTPTHLGFDEYDVASQGLVSHHYWLVDGQLETFSACSATSGPPSWTSWRAWPP
jgi:hypothetical protein